MEKFIQFSFQLKYNLRKMCFQIGWNDSNMNSIKIQWVTEFHSISFILYMLEEIGLVLGDLSPV